MKTDSLGPCPICSRNMFKGVYVDEHHLIPKAKNGKYGDKITVHRICHEKVHSIWTEKELANHYNTAAKIIEHGEIKKFIRWVSRKPSDFYAKTKMSNGRRR